MGGHIFWVIFMKPIRSPKSEVLHAELYVPLPA